MKKKPYNSLLPYACSKIGFVRRAKPLELISIIPLCAPLESWVQFPFISMCHETANHFFSFFFCSWSILKSFHWLLKSGTVGCETCPLAAVHTLYFEEFSAEPGYLSDAQQEANWMRVNCWQQLNLQTDRSSSFKCSQRASLYLISKFKMYPFTKSLVDENSAQGVTMEFYMPSKSLAVRCKS